MTTPSAPDAPTPRELAERLLHRPHPEGPTSVELIVGGLPAALRATLPLPADAPARPQHLGRIAVRQSAHTLQLSRRRRPQGVRPMPAASAGS
jgi:hypothetical protein